MIFRKSPKKRNSLKAASITLISVAVVSSPVKAHQSLTTKPAPITSDPRFTVPAFLKNQIKLNPIKKMNLPITEIKYAPLEEFVTSYLARLDPVH